MSEKVVPWGVTWMVVTGASRGMGAAICEGISPHLGPGSKILGIARSTQGLQDTAKKVQTANPKVKFVPVEMDLEKATKEDFQATLSEFCKSGQEPSPTRFIIFHNAGSLEPLKYTRDLKATNQIKKFFNFNISSVIVLNAVFLEAASQYPEAKVEVVNISSLCAVQAFKSWSLYCSAKAARDMFFKTLAIEESDVLVLNYAPGPLDNDMMVVARNETADEETKSTFVSMQKEGKLLPCSVSVAKLLQVLNGRKFKSGDHVDYFDE